MGPRGWRRRLQRQSGRLWLALACAVLGSLIRVGPVRAVIDPLLFFLEPSAEMLWMIQGGLLFLLTSLAIGALFAAIWLITVLAYPKARGGAEIAGLGYVLHPLLVRFVPGFDTALGGNSILVLMLGFLALQLTMIKTGLIHRPLPWRMTLSHRFWVPLSPMQVWDRLQFHPGAPERHYDPRITAISPPDGDGVIQVDFDGQQGAQSLYYTIGHAEPGVCMTRVCGTTRDEALSGFGLDRIHLQEVGHGTMVSVSERPSATLHLLLGHWLDNFFADYWDRAEAHLSGQRDWSVFGKLTDKPADQRAVVTP